MSVIRTDKWLVDLYDNPIEICEKIKGLFHDVSAHELYDYLLANGMYHPVHNGRQHIKTLQENHVWRIVHNEHRKLKRLWDGPDVPIFIFPSDSKNPMLKREFNGKSGLAYKDKLFLFVSEENEEMEIRALFTHEYSHVCRLSKLVKPEEDYVLVDSIILEGLAERAVLDRLGEDYVAAWTSYYSHEELENMWKNVILPNQNLLKGEHQHQEILYGMRRYPKMIGYCVGFFLVKKYVEEHQIPYKYLLMVDSSEIAQIPF